MELLTHIAMFLLSAAVIWFFSGILVESVSRVAQKIGRSGFSVAFFVLGFLTSIGEISVAFNSILAGSPDLSAGNLVGASIVILLLIIPLLAIAGNGIGVSKSISSRNLSFALLVITLPALFAIDGGVSRTEALIMLLLYATLLYLIERHPPLSKAAEELGEELKDIDKGGGTLFHGLRILGGATIIFLSGHILVGEAVYFANAFGAPASLIGLILISIGTNIPELGIALQAIVKRHKDVALGDYLGSAAANTVIFAFLALLGGEFSLEPMEFRVAFIILVGGLVAFYFFARSNHRLSRKEALILLGFYAVFLIIQLLTFGKLVA
jgi:cation:H+ antiporter